MPDIAYCPPSIGFKMNANTHICTSQRHTFSGTRHLYGGIGCRTEIPRLAAQLWSLRPIVKVHRIGRSIRTGGGANHPCPHQAIPIEVHVDRAPIRVGGSVVVKAIEVPGKVVDPVDDAIGADPARDSDWAIGAGWGCGKQTNKGKERRDMEKKVMGKRERTFWRCFGSRPPPSPGALLPKFHKF